MLIYEKIPQTNFYSWEFKQVEANNVNLSNAIYEVEVSYNCSFKVFDIETHYYIEALLPDNTIYKNCYWKNFDALELSNALKRDIASEWEDRLLKI